ncbi:serine palmitoyltransferase subunit I isoform X2 [Lycorma delicatula]|uniref:serine palmitoyltransferase subunit I isoform X2 n=1 Tax=Lycorma delicatula TaxID=130591 RepID=UPI003F51643A
MAQYQYNLLVVPFYHMVLEGLLLLWVLWLVFRKNNQNDKIQLSEKEKEHLISDWTPEPLVEPVPEDHPKLKERIVNGKVGKMINVDGHSCVNFASHNYIGFIENKAMEEVAINAIYKYGVGSCGPRGFYGTVDVHLELEERLANFMEVEEAVVYSYGFCTISSAIPAYAKRGDVIFVDECVNFAIQKGLDASRSHINYFKHNDVEDLERLLKHQAQLDIKNPKKAEKTRRFLIVEGIYNKTGQICPLPELIELRKKYKLRIFIDESISIGTLGKHGRGLTEYFHIPRDDVDLIMASMENAMATIGGFCVGSSFIVEHQRLSGLGYCFSASLPPLLAAAAIKALDKIEENTFLLSALSDRCHWVHNDISENNEINEVLKLEGHPDSPVKHLRIKDVFSLSYDNQLEILNKIVSYCMSRGIAVITSSYLTAIEKVLPAPSIRLTVSAVISQQDIKHLINVMEEACRHYLYLLK